MLKNFSDSKSMTLLNIKTYHYDIFDKFYRHYESLKNVQNITFFLFQNITFHGVICRFQRFCLNMYRKIIENLHFLVNNPDVRIEKYYQKSMIFSCPINFETPYGYDLLKQLSNCTRPKRYQLFFSVPNPGWRSQQFCSIYALK